MEKGAFGVVLFVCQLYLSASITIVANESQKSVSQNI